MTDYPKKWWLHRPIVLCLASLIFLAGCSNSTLIPTSTSIPEATFTSQPTLTIVPTSVPVFTIQNLDAQYPDGDIQFDPAFADIQSGTYIIGYGVTSSFVWWLYYALPDKAYYGNLATSNGVFDNLLSSYTYLSHDESLSANLENPVYTVVAAGLVPVDDTNSSSTRRINEIIIRSVKLRTREQHIWKVTFHPESGMLCEGVSLSPDHEWVAGNCLKDGENYLYFLNIQQGTVELLHSSQYPCLSGENNDPSWQYYNWSPDGQWLFVACTDVRDFNIFCLVSPETDEFACRPDGYYRPEAWSPDGSKVVVRDHGDWLVTDVSCLKDAQACPEYFRIPMNPVSGTPEYYSSSVTWDPTGKIIVWSLYEAGLDFEGPTDIWVVNLESGEKYQIGWARGTDVYSISPDGKWIVIHNDGGWGLLSIDGSVERGMGQEIDDFLGWLVVP